MTTKTTTMKVEIAPSGNAESLSDDNQRPSPVITNRRIKIGIIFDREEFKYLPGAINWRRREEAERLASLPLPEFIHHIKQDAQNA